MGFSRRLSNGVEQIRLGLFVRWTCGILIRTLERLHSTSMIFPHPIYASAQIKALGKSLCYLCLAASTTIKQLHPSSSVTCSNKTSPSTQQPTALNIMPIYPARPAVIHLRAMATSSHSAHHLFPVSLCTLNPKRSNPNETISLNIVLLLNHRRCLQGKVYIHPRLPPSDR